MFERYYSFFHYCLLCCRYVMFRKRILSESKWGGTSSRKGEHGPPGPPVATALYRLRHAIVMRTVQFSMFASSTSFSKIPAS